MKWQGGGLSKPEFSNFNVNTNYLWGLLLKCSQMALVAKILPAMQKMQEKKIQSLVQEDPLEEAMATHSHILAWRIPWTEEPGRGSKESDTT